MTEADLKRTVESYLELLYNQGKIYYERLNSGSLLASYDGKSYRRIRLCREGTADFIVVIGESSVRRNMAIIFLEIKAKTKQSEAQKQFQRIVEAQGAEYMLIKTIDEVIEALG